MSVMRILSLNNKGSLTMAKQYFDDENQIDYAKFIILILIVFFLGMNIGDMHAKKHCTCMIPINEVIQHDRN